MGILNLPFQWNCINSSKAPYDQATITLVLLSFADFATDGHSPVKLCLDYLHPCHLQPTTQIKSNRQLKEQKPKSFCCTVHNTILSVSLASWHNLRCFHAANVAIYPRVYIVATQPYLLGHDTNIERQTSCSRSLDCITVNLNCFIGPLAH